MKVKFGPVTRIEGHLNVTTVIEDNRVVDARCEGEMFRGFEIFLRGRDPLDAQQITQRICGVCPYAHAVASSYAQENAYGLQVSHNGRILHNLIQGANHLYDYLLHFYQLCALDFVDVTAITLYAGSDPDMVKLRNWVKNELASDRPFPAAPFLPRLSGRYIDDQEINLQALKNYLEAMEIQKKANRASALFGGKFPHATGIFPGGCTQKPTVDLILKYQSLIQETVNFYRLKYIPDVMAVAAAFPEYWNIGRSQGDFLSYGLLPFSPESQSRRLLAAGVLHEGRVDKVDFDRIVEDVRYSRYDSASGLKVRDGNLQPAPHKSNAYTWIKAPRYDGRMVEVGPAARVLVDYFTGNNRPLRELVNQYKALAGIEPMQFNSVLGRHLCRALSGLLIGEFLLEESERLDLGQPGMQEIRIPATGEGYGATEASRGALLHYIRLKDHRIEKYECVVPTTWNCSPRDDQSRPGALESALIGTYVEKPDEQIESVRIVHSFDPCLACAVH
ncbi:MAG: nickel-dependent hydrogenase large subunit [Deltaproteobacteria bacterium]|nr:nickel-dependent hydrogenase large subunit [Deltaproteobacteria bacterium]